MQRFLIVIEHARKNYSAYSPDLPGCVATGKTVKETEKNMHDALKMHVQGLIEDGVSVPKSQAISEYVVV